jgi:hypothetical protein
MCLNSRSEVSSLEPAFLLVTLMVNSPAASSGVQDMGPASQLEAETTEAKYDSFYSPHNRKSYDSFKYEALKPSDRRIRLLRIHPFEANADDTATVECDLIDDVSLEEYKGNFTTISYCAGDPRNIRSVLVNGEPFNAFANLDHALRQARHFWMTHRADRELLLWADQVCINQSNKSERSHQVGFMGEIYAAAEQVLVCLSTTENRGGGMRWLVQFVSDMRNQHHSESLHDLLAIIPEVSGPRPCNKALQLDFQSFRTNIQESPWWSRAWVRQELLRSNDAYFLASYDSMHISLFSRTIIDYSSNFAFWSIYPHKRSAAVHPDSCQSCVLYHFRKPFDPLPPIYLVNQKMKLDSSTSGFPDLLTNLMTVEECLDASEPKDLIYACLGYSSYSYGIEPDYNSEITFCDVACQLACNVINHHDNLSALVLGINYSPETRDLEFPTWVRDWRRQRGLADEIHNNALQCRQHVSFHADEQGRSNRVLQARGVILTADSTIIFSIRRERMAKGEIGMTELEENDEVWLLQGASCVYILRPKGQYHELVDRACGRFGDPQLGKIWIHKVANLVKNNYPVVQTIRIC